MAQQVVITLDSREHGYLLKEALIDFVDVSDGTLMLMDNRELVEDLILRISEAIS